MIHATSCDVDTGSAGLLSATAKGTSVVVNRPGETVVGQIEVWLVSSSGHVISKGKPWPLPKLAGKYRWTLTGFARSSVRPTSCVVQGINVAYLYNVPQVNS